MLYIVMFVFLAVNLKIGVFADSGLKVQAPKTAPTRVSRHPERLEKQNQSSAVVSRTPSKQTTWSTMVHFMDHDMEHDDHDMDHGIHDVYF